jgi:hypothetical protein
MRKSRREQPNPRVRLPGRAGYADGSLLRLNGYLIIASYSAAGLKLWSTVLASLAATVTFTSCSPSFSCLNAMV